MTEFIAFARDERLPVSMYLIQERGKIFSEELATENFKASNGRLQNYIQRSSVQGSLRLHGKDNAVLPSNHVQQMEALRCIAAMY